MRRRKPWGVNLIHSIDSPRVEEELIDLYLAKRVRRVCASAFMSITPAVVRYACQGLRTDDEGGPVRVNHIFAKLSRTEVAREFMSPPPPSMLDGLVSAGKVSRAEAEIAKRVPIAEGITVEADSELARLVGWALPMLLRPHSPWGHRTLSPAA